MQQLLLGPEKRSVFGMLFYSLLWWWLFAGYFQTSGPLGSFEVRFTERVELHSEKPSESLLPRSAIGSMHGSAWGGAEWRSDLRRGALVL